ncbi:MAG: c-type cytochrome [Rhizobacter sp.]
MTGSASLPVLLCGVLLLAACERAAERPDTRFTRVPGADPARGQQLLAQYQCGRCHVIPDVPAATGTSAPALTAWGRRSYIAGQLQNEPQNLQRWLRSPRSVVPGAAMPDLGVPDADARDMAGYLMGLR